MEEVIKMDGKRIRTEKKNKQVKCNVCLRKMESDTLKRQVLKHREFDEIRDEMKGRKKLGQAQEEWLKQPRKQHKKNYNKLTRPKPAQIT